MQVKLEKRFNVPADAQAVWAFMQDIKGVAECMPGAEITHKIDSTHFSGIIKVKIGPVSTAFNGKVEIKGSDAARRELKLLGTGTDVKGASTASMNLTATVRDSGNGTSEVAGVSEVNVSGKIASFGGRMMTDVSERLINQFAENFRVRVTAANDGTQPGAGAPAREINAFALVFDVLWDYLKRLFTRKSTGPGK
ncbi:MAG TPA: SRPBCC family protein [Acidiferrobacterales bacterium]|nr:SRPBCC family protein [Acidiferrobacterales bacterium]